MYRTELFYLKLSPNRKMKDKYKQEGWLREKYHGENLSQKEVSELTDVSRKTIGRWMDKFDIKTRDTSKASSISQQSCSGKHENEKWLREAYENKSLKDLSKICGCSSETIRFWMEKHGINRRKSTENVNIKCSGKHRDKDWLNNTYKRYESIQVLSEKCGCTPTTINKHLEKNDIERTGNNANCSKKHLNEEWIKGQFLIEKNAITEIADNCGCSTTVIYKSINKFELNRRDISADCKLYHRNKFWLECKYIKNNHNMKDLSLECGCSPSVIGKWLKRFNIDTHSGKFQSGESHWNYKHGRSVSNGLDFRKSSKWKEFSLNKKKDANWCCEYCSSNGRLHTHHVYPVSLGGKKWDNKFIVLCKNCHIGNYNKWHPPQLKDHI